MILAGGSVIALAGLVWVRNKSIRRRKFPGAPLFTHKLITTPTGYVAANSHCEYDEDEEENGEPNQEESEEVIWMPVIRPKFASKPKQRVHFQLSQISPSSQTGASSIDNNSSDNSESESVRLQDKKFAESCAKFYKARILHKMCIEAFYVLQVPLSHNFKAIISIVLKFSKFGHSTKKVYNKIREIAMLKSLFE